MGVRTDTPMFSYRDTAGCCCMNTRKVWTHYKHFTGYERQGISCDLRFKVLHKAWSESNWRHWGSESNLPLQWSFFLLLNGPIYVIFTTENVSMPRASPFVPSSTLYPSFIFSFPGSEHPTCSSLSCLLTSSSPLLLFSPLPFPHLISHHPSFFL